MTNITAQTEGKPAGIPANPQAKNTPTPSAPAVKKYCLSLQEWDGVNASKTLMHDKIDISEEDFKKLEFNNCKMAPKSLLKVGRDAMLDAFPFGELENAVNQSNALSMLLFEIMDYENRHCGNFTGNGPGCDTLLSGLQNLVWHTQERLSKAFYGPKID
jgi:hypothetical protein